MSKRVTKNCQNCGEEFSYFLSSNPNRDYCSRACQKAASRIDTTCPQCGKAFWYRRSWPRIYCSRKCSAAVNAKANLSIIELPPQFCEQCGKEILQDKKTGRRFCSLECFGAWQAQNVVGPAHPTFKPESHVERICQQCGNPFVADRNEVAKGWGVFCGRSCKHAWQKLHPPKNLPPVLSGPENGHWRGGYEPYYGPNWRTQRRNARRRDNYTCQRCGITESVLGRQLDVHHLTPFRTFGVDRYKEANQLDNLVSLCNVCHLIVENS